MVLVSHQRRFTVNSLEQLNGWSDTGVSFEDERPFAITFSPDTPTNGSINVDEEQPHNAYSGTDITSIVSLPGPITYSINIAQAPGTTVTWANTIPQYFTLSNTANVYQISGNLRVSDWATIRSPVITMPNDWTTNWTYTSTITYPEYLGSNTKTWTTTVTVTDLEELTSAGNVTYDEDVPLTLTSTPQIIDGAASGAYSITVSPAVTSAVYLMSSTGTGGTSTFNDTTKTLTIAGQKAEVNSHLGNILLTPGRDYTSDFVLNYSLTNPSSLITNVSQNLLIGNTNTELSNSGIDRTYYANLSTLLYTANAPQIVETLPGSPVIRIELKLDDDVGIIGFGESTISPVGWHSGNLTYTYSNTKANCNTVLSTVRFLPKGNTTQNTTLTLTQYADGVYKASDSVNFIGLMSATAITLPSPATKNFTSNSSFSLTYDQAHYLNYDILCVAGGGAGGPGSNADVAINGYGGGGGAGGVVYEENSSVLDAVPYGTSATFDVIVGEGGNRTSTTLAGRAGKSSAIKQSSTTLISATGGGGGGAFGLSFGGKDGGTGGSGGGGGGKTALGDAGGTGGSGITGQGYAGGTATSWPTNYGGGGGGAGSAGSSTGAGGTGFTSNISGSSVTYAIGGPGSATTMGNTAGSGSTAGFGNYTGTTRWAAADGKKGTVIVKFKDQDPALEVVYQTSVASTSSGNITIPAGAQVGDICVLMDWVVDDSAYPTSIVPTGFTSVVNELTNYARITNSYRVLTAGEPGSTITGLTPRSGHGHTKKIMTIVRPVKAISTITVTSGGGAHHYRLTNTDPSLLELALATDSTQSGMILAHYASTGNVLSRTSTTEMVEYANSETLSVLGTTSQYCRYKTYATGNAGGNYIDIDMADSGDHNTLNGVCIKVT